MINKKPYIEITSEKTICWEGWSDISEELKEKIKQLNKKKIIICVESYHGTFGDFNLRELKNVISPNVTCKTSDIYKDEQKIVQLLKKDIHGEFSKIPTLSIEDYFDQEKLESLRNNIDFIEEGVILIHGIGAYSIQEPDIIVYSDVSKYEILQRFRKHDISNLGVSNNDSTINEQHRWSYFVDWRICDRIKRQLILRCDYFLETNNWSKPKLATGDIVRKALMDATSQPFFTASFFDPELWEKTIHDTKEDEEFSWGFDCDMEHNNILLKLGETLFETPAINILYYQPKNLLGEALYRKYGSQMPIRFSFMDSMDNCKLQLSYFPGADHLREQYGINLSQNDNYYVMDHSEKAFLYVDFQETISAKYMEEILQTGPKKRELVKLLNKLHVKRHDHMYIPPEVIKSSGEGLMMLHISLSDSIFEHIIFDEELPQEDKKNNLIPDNGQKFSLNEITPTKERNWERLALSENQTLDLRRIWFNEAITLSNNDRIQVLNLIEGEEVEIQSNTDSFAPIKVSYAETFVIPGGVDEVRIIPSGNQKHGLLKGTIRV